MVLLVPDTEIEEEGAVLTEEDVAAPEMSAEDSRKAELDMEEDAGAASPEMEKVELDLEDAPFLEEEEEEEEEAPPPSAEPETEKGEALWYKKKSVYIPAAAVLVLLISLTIYFWTRPTPPPAPPEPEEEVQVAEPAPIEEEEKEFLVPLEPFWIEQEDDKGNIRFLVCRFTAVTNVEALSFELGQKTTTLRDAIFYYLKNKDLTYLSDKKNVEALKVDILSVMNQYLSAAQLDTLLIEEYLVK